MNYRPIKKNESVVKRVADDRILREETSHQTKRTGSASEIAVRSGRESIEVRTDSTGQKDCLKQ